MNDLISLIIPCYNASLTISKCLDSVISQSFQNLEIIIINDGSTDSTLDIINQYRAKDSRIILINRENSGVSKARNLGIEKAGGAYICFVDSDDWVEKDYCSTLYQSIKENEADISIAEAFYEDVNGNEVAKHQTFAVSNSIYNKETALKLLLEDKIIQSHPWAKLYKSELLKNISFPEKLEAFEDYFTMFKVFNSATTLVKTEKKIYHYVQFEDSLSHNLTPKRAYHFFLALMEAYNFLNSQVVDSSFRKSIIQNILKKIFMVLKRIIRNTTEDEMISEKEEIRRCFSNFMRYGVGDIGLEYYIYARLFLYYPKLYTKIISK